MMITDRASGTEITRAPHPSPLADTALLAQRCLRLMSRRPASLISALFMPLLFASLYFTVFQRPMQRAGIDYAQYLLPAVIIQAVFFTGMSGSVLAAEDSVAGLLRRLRGMPISRMAPVGGLLAAELVRAVVSTAVLVPVGFALGFRFESGVAAAFGFVGLICLFSLALCTGYLALGLALGRPEVAAAVGSLVFFPLLLFSGAFTPVAAFPDRLEPVVENQPISRVAEALRALSTEGVAAGRPVLVAVAWLVPLLVIFGALATRAFGRRR